MIGNHRNDIDASAPSGQGDAIGDKPMTSWMKERDRLLQQTLAFVQDVAAQRPNNIAAAKIVPQAVLVTQSVPPAQSVPPTQSVPPVPAVLAVTEPVLLPETNVASAETDALISLMALLQPATSHNPIELPPEKVPNAESPDGIRAAPQIPLSKPRQNPRAVTRPIEMALPERDVIAQRVARFRAGQQKFIRDRDDNYVNVQATIRVKLAQIFSNEPSSETKPSED